MGARTQTLGRYLHGPVGRGKTWLVDELLAQLPTQGVLRLHAYEAARQLHAQVARHAGASGATDRAVEALLNGVQLLFLDELHAHDPGDAMLLSRLVRALPDRAAVLVATSNYPPQGLLPDPLALSRSAGPGVSEVLGPTSDCRTSVWGQSCGSR